LIGRLGKRGNTCPPSYRHSIRITRVDQRQSLEVALNSASPCEECRHRARCKADLLTCDAWAVYLAGGSETRWKFAPRAPTRARYESLPAFACAERRAAVETPVVVADPFDFDTSAEQMVQRVGRQPRLANPLLPARSGRFLRAIGNSPNRMLSRCEDAARPR